MKVQCWGRALIALLAGFFICGFSFAQVMQVEDLIIGTQKKLEFPKGVKKIAIVDDSMLDVVIERGVGPDNPAKLLLTPLKSGTTSVMVWQAGAQDPRSIVFNIVPFLNVKNKKYDQLSDMAISEAALNDLGGKTSADINLNQLIHKSNVVQVDVKIVELNKNRLQQAGINIFSNASNSQGFSFGVISAGGASGSSINSSSGAVQGGGGSPFSQAFGLLMNFSKANIGLNLGVLEGGGMARILAEPTLLAISGQSANFLAGGEIPIPVGQGNGSTSIEYKSYGVGLTVSPTILDNNRIVLKVAPESSELDYANAVTLQSAAVPALTVRKADTTVELGDGESFVIGGLVSQNTSSTINKVPFLGEIPILGMLFKRQEFSRKERELVIVVTPRLVKPIAANANLGNHLPGASQAGRLANGFWSSYIGPTGGVDQFPGFSQ